MSQIKVSELFYSLQGEGRFMGAPSVFLRTFGCNFTCSGFGMPRGEFSNERNEVPADAYTEYRTLPLLRTGCDSYAAWDPRFKHLSPLMDTRNIVEAMINLLPNKRWDDEHLVITGGEPLLGWQRSFPDLLSHPQMTRLKQLTFETNGTQYITNTFRQCLLDWTLNNKFGPRGYDSLTFSVSPKLSISGEKWEEAIIPEIIVQYEEIGFTYLKFVVETESDVVEAQEAVKVYREAGFTGPVYLMPCGGVEVMYETNKRPVAIMAMNNGWRYSDRLQVPLFKNEWGT